MDFLQWMGLEVSAAVLCLVVRQQQPQLASLCALAAGCILLLGALGSVSFLQEELRKLTALAGLREETLTVFMKVLGMSYTAELTAQTCSDLGENSLALKVQLLGKLSVFTLTAPLLLELLTLILELAP